MRFHVTNWKKLHCRVKRCGEKFACVGCLVFFQFELGLCIVFSDFCVRCYLLCCLIFCLAVMFGVRCFWVSWIVWCLVGCHELCCVIFLRGVMFWVVSFLLGLLCFVRCDFCVGCYVLWCVIFAWVLFFVFGIILGWGLCIVLCIILAMLIKNVMAMFLLVTE